MSRSGENMEKEQVRRVKKRRKKKIGTGQKKRKIWKYILAAVILLAALLAAAFFIMQALGRYRLYGEATSEGTTLSEAISDSEQERTEVWEDDWIRYEGNIYDYNDDILTFLVLGIDKMEEVTSAEDSLDGGQSDLLFLAVLNPHTKEISLIAINRDTITDVDMYDEDGNFIATEKKQITLQHGYGDGKELSCERSVKAVSRLFYGLPIHGYCSVNMEAIPIINDIVGGVDVTVLETLKDSSGTVNFQEGETVHLEGMNAFWYVKFRDIYSFNSAGRRLERQKQYLQAWSAKAREALGSNPGLALELYSALSGYMVTDITLDEVNYLASIILDYSFSGDRIYSLEGETVVGDWDFEEFYPDEEALYELILDIFYEPV